MSSTNLNRVTLLGYVGNNPDISFLEDGTQITRVSVGTNESWKDKQTQEKFERVDWHNIVCFGKLAEIIGERVKKRSHVYVEGKLRTDKVESDNGDKYFTKVRAEKFILLGGKSNLEKEFTSTNDLGGSK